MGDGPSTLAQATAISDHTAAEPVTLTITGPLSPRRPAGASAEELVPGLPQALRGPTCLSQAAHECQREDVLLDDGRHCPRGSHHQTRYSGELPWWLRGWAHGQGLSFCLISPILKWNISNCEKKNNWDKQKTVKDLILTIWTTPCDFWVQIPPDFVPIHTYQSAPLQ